jgi:bifunctional UDP-N-acetylglucosamine pyrophosphorylase/glucosamine-1-phosphate N-acetyltransferase
MEPRPGLMEKIKRLTDKGVDIPNPLTLDIGDEVDAERISGKGVKIFPGCRIYGAKTVISAGAVLGREGPVTVEDCQMGPGVELRGGYFSKSVFLEKSSMGLGAQVRDACILEEEAGGAHCVGLKQTILFPFVTLGSLINFCDCLMAGGTSRKNHSEVGSSYIHFNFTPDGDKSTASLIGDVPRGVMLNQPPIFLGGQGGMVGPLRLGFGNVVSAGSMLRRDFEGSGKLIYGRSHHETMADFVPGVYPRLARIVGNNILYIASLAALEQWYIHVRRPFFKRQELGELVYQGAMEKIAMAGAERHARLEAMAAKLSIEETGGADEPARRDVREKVRDLRHLMTDEAALQAGIDERDRFLEGLERQKGKGAGYIEDIQGLPAPVSQAGTRWLDLVIDGLKRRSEALLPSLEMFGG